MGRFEDEVVKATSRTMDMLLYGMSIGTLRAMHADCICMRDSEPPYTYTTAAGFVQNPMVAAWHTSWDVLAWHIADVIEVRNAR